MELDDDVSGQREGQRLRHRRRSSIIREAATEELARLPLLRDVPAQEHVRLFRLKLGLCQVRFNFEDPGSDQMGKDLKRNTLLELIDYVNSDRGQKIFTAPGVMEDCISMVSANIFRCLPPQIPGFDAEEDEPVFDPSWPHLQVVYEFLLRFVVSKEVSAKVAKRKDVVDQAFCVKLVQTFDSEDQREREYLKTRLHRVYGKFTSHRSFIRKQISHTFQRLVFDTERHNGISELLEILGSIINGFALPLKAEHLRFLQTSLLPLHASKSVCSYHHQLSYCVIQYIERDSSTAPAIVKGLAKYWPWSESSKQVMFLNELEDVLESADSAHTPELLPYVLKIVSRSIASEHFQVIERTLYLWNNEVLATNLFGKQYSHIVFPPLHPLICSKELHWNTTVRRLADEVIRLFQRANGPLWAELESKKEKRKAEEQQTAESNEKLWQALKQKHNASPCSSTMDTTNATPQPVQPPDSSLSKLSL
eukprot:CAMPEP_0184517434 /NCGR_PEP_ID=MMETSP0198_2-20121128/5556_1 /TAXON_ID=1112570 /ORGANISM="Thraustochytrium sp., Strain LLF1b" /LENGTH=478 /DNA_ID=CAMNT_0026907813 /DNA_START=330 /DNA_END=1766 /DNA_ORIENTATION=-